MSLDLSCGLLGLMTRAAAADPAAAAAPVREIAFGDKWLAVRLEGDRCGRAFAFTGAHEVYGPFDLDVLQKMRRLVGMPASEAFVCAASEEGARLFGRMAATLQVAVINAVADAGNAPEALKARGVELLDDCVGALVRPQDRVVVVGAGMFLPELAASEARVDVVDLRPACDLMGARVSAEGVELLPHGLAFHTGADETAGLFAEADVLLVTGSTLVNGTFFELMALPRRARDVVLFGPSASGPFEALAELGVTCVAGNATLDADALMGSVAQGVPNRKAGREACASYVAHLPHPRA